MRDISVEKKNRLAAKEIVIIKKKENLRTKTRISFNRFCLFLRNINESIAFIEFSIVSTCSISQTIKKNRTEPLDVIKKNCRSSNAINLMCHDEEFSFAASIAIEIEILSLLLLLLSSSTTILCHRADDNDDDGHHSVRLPSI